MMKGKILLIFCVICIFAVGFIGGMSYNSIIYNPIIDDYKELAESCVNTYGICMMDYTESVELLQECIDLQPYLVYVAIESYKEEHPCD